MKLYSIALVDGIFEMQSSNFELPLEKFCVGNHRRNEAIEHVNPFGWIAKAESII